MGNRSKWNGKGPSKRYPRKKQTDDRALITYTRDEVFSFNLATIEGCEKLDNFLKSVTRINNKN